MKRSLLSFLSFFFISTTFAQQLTGHIKDEWGNAVELASVSLYKLPDSTLSNGVLSDKKGHFQLKNLSAGTYSLQVKFIGFKTFKKSIQVVSGQNISAGTIVLSVSSKALEAVSITGNKAAGSHKIDKQVFGAAQFQSAQGGTALDVIKNTPSVSVNSEGDIALRGSGGILVLLNGKPVQANPKEILTQLPANSIDNIEIITSPSAKYDPDGKSGIINIVTKRGQANQQSYTANLQGGWPSVRSFDNLHQPQRYGADVAYNSRTRKWDVSLAASYLRNDLAGRREGDVNTTLNGIFTRFPSLGERSFKRYNHTFRTSVSFSPDKKNTLVAGFYNGRKTQYRRADILYHNTRNQVSDGTLLQSFTYFNSNVVKKLGDFTLGNLDFSHQFDNKSTLTISGLVEQGRIDALTTNNNQNYPLTDQFIQKVENTGKNPLNAWRLKLDYAINLGKGKLETGYQYRFQEQNGDFRYEIVDPATNTRNLVSEFSSTADLTNKIHSVYAQYGAKREKWEYNAGLRYEYATRVFDGKEPETFDLALSNVFPSASLLYSVRPDLRVKAGFSSRIQRSTNNELNPYPEREHSETLEQGDPNIRPEMVNVAELGFIKEGRTGNFAATFYHQRINHVINRVNSVYNDTILNRIFTNAGTARLSGLELSTSFKPLKWYQFYLGWNIYDYRIKGSLFNRSVPVNSSAWVYSINTNSNIGLGKNWNLQWNLNYLSERVTAQGKDSRFLIPNSSIKKVFWKGKASATLQWQNMDLGLLNTNEQRITTWGANFYTTTNYVQEKDIFLLNLSIHINQALKKAKLPSSEFGDKEF